MTSRRGFSLIELILVMGLITTLLAFTSVNLLTSQRQASVTSSAAALLADIKNQQLKAMTGDTDGRPTTDNYGVYMEPDKYTLFHGSVYSAADPDNFVVDLDASLVLSTAFPSSTLLFSKGSGEITSFTAGSDTLTISSTAESTSRTFQFNLYGTLINDN